MSFEHNSNRKNLFLSACFCWDSVSEMDQKVIFGGTIGYWNSCMEFLFRNFKVFWLHVVVHDAAEAVRAHSGIGPGHCNLIGRGRLSYLLGHLTGLLS